jgi:hypothetical protein
MKTVVVLGIVAFACQPASAITCEQVRHYVEAYGAAAVLAFAKKAGATPQQIRDGRACLRRVDRQQEVGAEARDIVAR